MISLKDESEYLSKDIVNKLKNYFEEKELKATVYLCGSSCNKKQYEKDIDVLIIPSPEMSFEEEYKLQENLANLLGKENVFINPFLRNAKETEPKVHLLIYNDDINPIFIREILKDGVKLICGKDVLSKLLSYLEAQINLSTYLGYIKYTLCDVVNPSKIDSNRYPVPEKELKERRKFVEKTIEVIKRDLKFKFNEKNVKSDEEFMIKAQNFLTYVKREIEVKEFAKIRKIESVEDLRKIKAFFNYFLNSYPHVPRKSEITEEDIEKWECALHEKKAYGVVIDINGRIVGACALNKIEIDSVPDKTYRISITLSPKYKGMGLGKKLIEKIIDMAREDKIETIVDDTHVNNGPMIGILEGMGWTNLTLKEKKPPYYDGLVKMYTEMFDEKIPEEYNVWMLNLTDE